jgi:hypothetical protein
MTTVENLVSATGEKLLTLDAALALIKREQGREARSLLLRAYACYCARSITRTDKLLKRALESAGVKLALSTAKRDASIYFTLATMKVVREGKIVEDYASYLDVIASSWEKIAYASKIPGETIYVLTLAGLARKSDLRAIVAYNSDSKTVEKVTALQCLEFKDGNVAFVLPEAVQSWLQLKKGEQREITSGEIGQAVDLLLAAIEHKSEQALEALQLLASRAGYQLVAVSADVIATEQAEADEPAEAESELAVVAS